MSLKNVALTGLTAILVGCSGGPKLEGKYRDPSGNFAEFMSDGRAIFEIGGRRAVWTWTTSEGSWLKLEPDPSLGVSGATCAYRLTDTALHVTGCDYAMDLARI